jgi:hypothetical protein
VVPALTKPPCARTRRTAGSTSLAWHRPSASQSAPGVSRASTITRPFAPSCRTRRSEYGDSPGRKTPSGTRSGSSIQCRRPRRTRSFSRLLTSSATSNSGVSDGIGGGIGDGAPGRGPDRPSVASLSRAAAAGSSTAVTAATARAARTAGSGSTAASMRCGCPSRLASAWRPSARARACRPACSASSAASAAHQGELDGTGLVARAASRRARLDSLPASPASGESTPALSDPVAVPDTMLGACAPNRRVSIAATCSLTTMEPSVPVASTTTRHSRPSARSKARSRPGTGIKEASPAAPAGRPSRITWPVSRSKLGVRFITTTWHRIAALASTFWWNLGSCPVRTAATRSD